MTMAAPYSNWIAATRAVPAWDNYSMTTPPSAGRTVLVVEDDYFIADALTTALEEEDMHVLGPFPSVATACKALDDGKQPDVAVLDVNLQGERIYPLLDRLMREDTPVVLTTAYDGSAIPDMYRSLPRLQKPVPLRHLIDCVNQLLAF
jgi:DNA-binding NtrC family response regulator